MSDREPGTFRSERAARVRSFAWLKWAGALLLLGMVLFGGRAARSSVPLILAIGIAAGASFLRRARQSAGALDRAPLEADESGVRYGARLLARREQLTHGLAAPAQGGCHVRLFRKWPMPPIELVLPNEAEGRALLSALGLDAEQTSVDLPTGSGYLLLSWPTKAGFIAAFALGWLLLQRTLSGLGFGLGFWLAFIVGSALAKGQNSRVRVGVDGVHFRWLWIRQFTRFADLRSMRLVTEEKSELLELTLLDGSTRKIPIRVGNRDEGNFVHRRILQAFEAYRAREGAGAIEALARGDQQPAEWLMRLRGLAAGANAGMRTAPVPVDRIWAVLDDPSAPAAARAGAAAALASGATARDRERIRVAASAVAEPKLRVAIQKAAEESVDDRELAEVLAEVEDAERAAAGKQVDRRRDG